MDRKRQNYNLKHLKIAPAAGYNWRRWRDFFFVLGVSGIFLGLAISRQVFEFSLIWSWYVGEGTVTFSGFFPTSRDFEEILLNRRKIMLGTQIEK